MADLEATSKDSPVAERAPVPTMIRLASYGVIRRDGLLLLCRIAAGSLGQGQWVLPGGGVEFGESPAAAALREVEEETGLRASIEGPPEIHSDTGRWEFADGSVDYHTVRFVYPMSVVGGEERVEVGGSTDAFEWLGPADLERIEAAGGLGDLVVRVLGSHR